MEDKGNRDQNEENREIEREVKKETNREIIYALELVSKLGISIAIIAGGFILGGIYLDRRFGTGYLFIAAGFILSVIVSIYNIYWQLEPFIGSEKRKNFLKRKKK